MGFNIWDKIYTIKKKKINEYEITQIANFKTKSWETTEYYASETSWIFKKIDIDLDNIWEVFTSKEEAERVLDIIKKYT